MFPFTDTAPRAAWPAITLGLIGVNTLVFLWMWSLPPEALNVVLAHVALIPIRYTEPGLARHVLRSRPDQFLAAHHQHVHAWRLAAPHLQHVVPVDFRARHGGPVRPPRLRVPLRGWSGGGGASLVHVLTHATSVDPVLGASGAIAAVIGAHAVSYPTARVVTIVLLGFIPLFIPLPAVLFALIWFALKLERLRADDAQSLRRRRLVGAYRRLRVRRGFCAGGAWASAAAARCAPPPGSSRPAATCRSSGRRAGGELPRPGRPPACFVVFLLLSLLVVLSFAPCKSPVLSGSPVEPAVATCRSSGRRLAVTNPGSADGCQLVPLFFLLLSLLVVLSFAPCKSPVLSGSPVEPAVRHVPVVRPPSLRRATPTRTDRPLVPLFFCCCHCSLFIALIL